MIEGFWHPARVRSNGVAGGRWFRSSLTAPPADFSIPTGDLDRCHYANVSASRTANINHPFFAEATKGKPLVAIINHFSTL